MELIKKIANGAIKGAIISHNIANEKVRKIVAMLFWEWKKARDFDIRNTFYFAFKKAYSMLKW